MQLSIIHLTDIHFSIGELNSILAKKTQLIKAIISEIRNAEHVVFIVSGDIANFGIEEEYQQFALPFFIDIENSVKNEIPNLTIEFFFTPGNHDCNFTQKEEMDVRDTLIKSVLNDHSLASKSSYISKIISQNDFNVIKEIFHEQWKYSVLTNNNQLFEKIELTIHNKNIVFNLFNSSWISSIKEHPGHMYYPVQYSEKIATSTIGDVNFSVIHHPTHWLEPNNKREMEDLLLKISDFIITGHEHIPSKVMITDWSNRSVNYVEGAAIQELGDPSKSGFNIIHVNLDDMKFIIKNYQWQSLYYKCKDETEEWRLVSSNASSRFSDHNTLKITTDFSSFLNDLALQVTHPRVHSLKLNDIYVFPNVEEIHYDEDGSSNIKSEEIAEIIKKDKTSHLFFSGDKDSGKTALGKMLFQYFYSERYYPLYIDGSSLSQSLAKNINLLLNSEAKKIYSDDTLYVQMEREKRILIIDDWQKSPINTELRAKFLNEACKFFNQVIIFAESNNSLNESIKLFSREQSMRHFEIMSFGHAKRNEFIEKWVTLGQRDTLENDELIREIDRINRAIKPIILQSFVPRFPLYLLVIIKTVEAGKPHDFEKSSNAYYFEVLIKDSIASLEIENRETDKIYQYLTDMAYEMHKKPSGSLTIEEWRNFHKNHLEYYDMSDDQIVFKDVKSKLEREKIIKLTADGYEYNYSYMYYFFVAQYIARKINLEEIKSLVSNMCRDIHVTDNANIIMFLTHLSKDEFIKTEVLNAAKNILQDLPLLKLEDDVALINEMCEELFPLVLQDVDVREHRKNLAIKMDEHERESQMEVSADQDEVNGDDETMVILNKVNLIEKGTKMLDIIGQILKNYYGSMSGTDKYILCEELFKLGLRINYCFIEDLRDNNKLLVEFISSIIIERKLEKNKERADKLAKNILYNMGGIITNNNIMKIAFSVGTPDLDRTYLKVKESLSCNSAELAYLFIRFEYYDKFPYTEVKKFYQANKTNKIVVQILQNMVKRYLYMYETSRSERQKICDLVGMKIDFTPIIKQQKRDLAPFFIGG